MISVSYIHLFNTPNINHTTPVYNSCLKFRSPEEYEYGDQTEKVDIYSMGNVFYVLLTATWPWDGTKEEEAQKLVKEGKRPYVNGTILNSTNPIDQALLKAMDMCYVHDPSKRASAKEVLNFLISINNNITRS
jgi:serine/threonine protein kinase